MTEASAVNNLMDRDYERKLKEELLDRRDYMRWLESEYIRLNMENRVLANRCLQLEDEYRPHRVK